MVSNLNLGLGSLKVAASLFSGSLKKMPKLKKDAKLKAETTYCIHSRWIFESHREKTCLQSFRPGPTQTRLYNHRRSLEARGLKLRI